MSKQGHWKSVGCPTCDSKVGQSCGKIKRGTFHTWIRTAPHIARKRLALLDFSMTEEDAAEAEHLRDIGLLPDTVFVSDHKEDGRHLA